MVTLQFLIDLVAVWDSPFNYNFKCGLFLVQFAAWTDWTFVLDKSATAAALVAMRLLLDSTVTHLLGANDYAFSLAFVTLVRVAVFGTRALALGAYLLFVLLEFEFIAIVNVF